MSQSESDQAMAAEERSQETRSFVRRAGSKPHTTTRTGMVTVRKPLGAGTPAGGQWLHAGRAGGRGVLLGRLGRRGARREPPASPPRLAPPFAGGFADPRAGRSCAPLVEERRWPRWPLRRSAAPGGRLPLLRGNSLAGVGLP